VDEFFMQADAERDQPKAQAEREQLEVNPRNADDREGKDDEGEYNEGNIGCGYDEGRAGDDEEYEYAEEHGGPSNVQTEGYFYSKYSQLRAAHSQLVSNVGSLQRQSERLLNENVVLEEHVKAQHGAFFKKQAAMERAQRQIAAERTCLVKETELQERRKNWLAVQSERLRSRKVMERGAAGSILNGPGDVVQAEVAGAEQMAKEQKLHPQDFVHGHLDNAKADRLERNRRRGVLKMSEDERKMRNLNSRMMRTAEKEHERLASDRRRCFDEDNRGSKHGQRLEAQAQAQCTVSNELKVGYKAVRQRVLARENAKEAERRGVERMREKADDFRRLQASCSHKAQGGAAQRQITAERRLLLRAVGFVCS
jgi:hypothetical protein